MALQFLNDGYFAGKVGIGTASPENLLHIKAADGVTGVLKIEGGKNIVTSANEINSQLDFGSNDGSVNNTGNVGGRISSITENTNGALVGMAFSTFQQSRAIDLQEAMRITNAGNIGIGTTSSNARLDVIGVGLSSLFRVSNTDADATTKYGTFMGRHYTNSEENITGMLLTSSSSVTGGAVSIGGGVTSANAVNEIKFYTAANNTTLTGSERMRITSAGNVGIGTTSPQSKLQVAGGIQMADDTDTASADKVGTMRYRTGTEYVEVTGTELITNGDFASSSNWSVTGGWTISSGKANYATAVTSYLVQTGITLTSGVVYRLRFNVSGSSGNGAFIWIGNQAGNVNYLGASYKYYADGDFEEIFTMPSNQTAITFYSQVASSNFSMDNVTLMEVTAEDASYADMCMQTGASTYEWVNIVRNTY